MTKLILGDCYEKLKEIESCSVDSVVTDPPAGVGFRETKWDGNKGGRDEWIAWLTQIMKETLRVLKPGGHMLVWALPRTSHWTAFAVENAGFQIRDRVSHVFATGYAKGKRADTEIDRYVGAKRTKVIGRKEGINFFIADGQKAPKTFLEYAPETQAAKAFEGWNTCLKPAMEDWWLCRKPMERDSVAKNVLRYGTGAMNLPACKTQSGRLPSNLTYDGSKEVADLLPESVQRIMYCAKASTRDRQEGVKYEKQKPESTRWFRNFDHGGNNHPTVKSTELMRWLVRLVTPRNGLVLDPFMGSGSTGKAAVIEKFDFIGIEMLEEYYNVAKQRIGHAIRRKGLEKTPSI